VNRNRHARAEQLRRAGGPLWVEVTGPQRRAPSPDGQEGEIETGFESVHALEEVGVTREVDRAAAADHEPNWNGPWTEDGPAASVMDRRRGHDLDAAHILRLAGGELLNVGKSPAAQKLARPARHEQPD
jgi:hypothetical protein